MYDYIDKDIWLVFSCDKWKGNSSMNLVLVTTDETRLRDFLREEIKNRNMEYAGLDEDIDAAIQEFDEDWETSNMTDVNSKLSYGFYYSTSDGEEI